MADVSAGKSIISGEVMDTNRMKIKLILKIDFILFPCHSIKCRGILNEKINLLVYSVSGLLAEIKLSQYQCDFEK